jgi:hypothetical protein
MGGRAKVLRIRSACAIYTGDVLAVTVHSRTGSYTAGRKEPAMRFASVVVPPPEPQRQAASEFMRKLVAPVLPLPAQPAFKLADLPLDQRVRLVGEW